MSGSGTGTRATAPPSTPAVAAPAVTLMAADLHLFYDLWGESVDIESKYGETMYPAIKVILSIGQGEKFHGDDAPGADAELRIRVSEVSIKPTGYKVYRGDEEWKILKGGDKSEDGLEWVLPISKLS